MSNSEQNFMSVISKLSTAQSNDRVHDTDTLYEDVPIVNIQRSVQVVYSKDSPKSIKAASTIKSLIESIEKGSIVDSVYGFRVTEIGDLVIKDVADVYIWIDLPKSDVSENPVIMDMFNQSEHHSVVGNGAGPWVHSYFGECIENFVASGGYKTRYVNDASEAIRDPLTIQHTLHIGVILNSICAISYAVPELIIPEVDRLIEYLSYMENQTVTFFSKQANTKDILKEFTAIHNGLVNLTGLGERFTLSNTDTHLMQRLAEGCPIATTYSAIYKQVRDQLFEQGVTCSTNVTSTYKCQIAYTRIQNHVWMARRIAAMTDLILHNTRIAAYGSHSTSTGPKIRFHNEQQLCAIKTTA